MRPGGGFALKKIIDPGLILGTKEYVLFDQRFMLFFSVCLPSFHTLKGYDSYFLFLFIVEAGVYSRAEATTTVKNCCHDFVYATYCQGFSSH